MNAKWVFGFALALASGAVSAASISPQYTTFGTLAGATFGGSGIPNNAVAITTTADLTLGLTAHQRYEGPFVSNNGAGTFTAVAGLSQDSPSPADPYATWNFAFYIAGTNLSSYVFRLFYDFDPAAGNDQSTHGALGPFPTTGTAQESWNLGMNFLAAAAAGVAPPAFGPFDPNAIGQYTFALVAYTTAGAEVARSAIRVNVAAVPEPAALALFGLGLFGVGLTRRRSAS